MSAVAELSGDEAAVLDYLRAQWDKLFRLATVAQAVAALGLPWDDAARLRLGDYLLAHPALHPLLERWGVLTFVLTEDEKLLARALLQRAVDGRGRVERDTLAATLKRTVAAVERGANALQHTGLLTWREERGAIVYAFASNWPERVGPLAFAFHTVTLEGGEQFNVP